MAKLRLGVLPIRLETGRNQRPILPADQRLCQQCSLGVPEDEVHFTLECPRNQILREKLLSFTNESFHSLDSTDKLRYLLNNSEIVKQTSQFIIDAFDNRLIM